MDEEQKKVFDDFKDVDSDVWTPKNVGDSIEGVLVHKIAREGEISARYYVDIWGKSRKLVWGTAVLDNRMALVEVGNAVRITYKGKEKNKKGQPLHIWKVEEAERKWTKEELR